MIEVQHLTKRYGPFTAVDDVSFRVERGEILGFLGPNGAGKTTTMRVLTGYMPPTEGKAIVAGYDVFEQPIEAKRRTGYLPETPPLYPEMTVRDYLTFVARIKGVPRAERKARVNTVMERTRIADMAKRHCGKLSKGYRQRVGLAQALLHNPDVLILDEPTAGLDPKQIIETRQLDQGTRRRPHGHPEHAHPSRSQPDLPARRHHQQGPRGRGRHAREPDGAASRIGNDVRAGRRGGRRREDGARAVPGVTPRRARPTRAARATGFEVNSETGRDVRRDLAAAIVTPGWGLLELRPLRMSLEEIFLHLTTEETAAPAAAVEVSMNNILAIAHKELKGYFASPIAYIVIGFSAILFGWFFVNLLYYFDRMSLQAGIGPGRPGDGQRQRDADLAAVPQRQRDPAVHPAADHDADLRGGKALGHDRAAADVAADRFPDRHRQVPGRPRALRRDARRHARPHRHSSSPSAIPSGGPSSPAISGCC